MGQEPETDRGADQRAAVWAAARVGDIDRYLAALLAPRSARDDLVALSAFVGEIGRIPMLVRDPLLAEIRLHWWRERLESLAAGTRSGNPIADGMAEVVLRRGLDPTRLVAIVDAGSMLVEQDGIATPARLAAFLDAREGSAMSLAAHILGSDAERWSVALDAAARAYGLVRVLLDFPAHRERGRALPAADMAGLGTLAGDARSHLGVARRALVGAPREILIAALPAALVEPYLRVFEENLRQPAGVSRRDIQPLTRAWRLWQARWRGI